ncbi:MAG: TlpA family protein disulfide reductase [Deltaproteobacteria bacterium]|nr:TlpA family protein disulfide reductase [Deltaproteobacteria bacterium]
MKHKKRTGPSKEAEEPQDAQGEGRTEKRGLSRSIGGLIVALALAILVINAVWLGKHCGGLRAPHKGSVAPSLALRDLSGKVHTLKALHGKVVILDFWATWCPPCVAKVPHLEALADEFESRGLRILGVSVDRNLGMLKSFVGRRAAIRKREGKGPSKVVVLRSTGRVSAAYGAHSLPHVTLVNRQGQIVYVHIGGGGLSELRERVLEALASP